MPGAADWQNLPNSVTDSIQNSDLADSWAQDQQTRIASDWANYQRMVPPPQQPPPAPTDASAPAGPAEAVYNVQSGDTLSGIAQRLGVPIGQLVSANKISNPNLINAGQTLNIGTSTAAPVGPGADMASAKPVASANGNVPDWLVQTIRNAAPDDLKDDPEFLKIVAAGSKAESNWDPRAIQQGGGGRGLFQFDIKGGMGKGATQDQINDPDWQAAKIMPRYAAAYKDGLAQGLKGAELASYVAAQAEHPLGYDNPQSAARQNYRTAYSQISYTPGQAGAANAAPQAPSPSANDLDLAGTQTAAAGSPTGLPSPTGPQPVNQGAVPVENQRQFEQQAGLSDADAYSACGPVAAVAFAKTYGRNPTPQEAIQLAREVGWTPGSGMAGVASEQALLTKMGTQTKLETQVNWSNVQKDVQNGNPVIISTPNHYFYVSDYDPASDTYGVGESGTVFKNGASRMSAADIAKRGGGISGALYVDHPQAEGPSVAETAARPSDQNPIGAAASAVQQKLGQVKDAVVNADQQLTNNGTQTPLQGVGGILSNTVAPAISNSEQVPGAPGLTNVLGAATGVAGQILQAPPIDQQQPSQMVLASLGAGGGGSEEVAQLTDQFNQYAPQIKAALQKQADVLSANGVGLTEIGDRMRTWMKANPPETVNSVTKGKAGVDTSPQAAAAQSSTPAGPAETASAPQSVSAPPAAPSTEAPPPSEPPPPPPPTDNAAAPPPPEGQPAGPTGWAGGAPPPDNAPTGVTSDTLLTAHNRIDQALGTATPEANQAHAQLDQMIQDRASPAEIARFLSGDVEGSKVDITDIIRAERTGSMAGGLNTTGKVALSPIIQTAMRAPAGALKAIVTGNPQDIATGMQGGMAGLAEGSMDAMQTLRYGINYRAALTGGAQGGYGFKPGLDVMGANPLTRAAGTALTGLVRTHGAASDVSAGIGRGVASAQGASPQAAQEVGQQWAMRSGNYGTVGKAVSNALDTLKNTNPAMDVVGQILMPFYRVAYNVTTQGIERSPLGLAGTGFDVARAAVGRGPYAATGDASAVTPLSDRLANNMFGVGLAAYGFSQAAQGNITGEHPANGAPAWSVRVAGNWVPLRTLGPAGESLAQAAALYESARDGKNVQDDASKLATEYVNHIYDETWLRSLGDTFNTIGDAANLGSTNRSVAGQAAADLKYQGSSLVKSFIPQASLISQAETDTGNQDTVTPLANAAVGRQVKPKKQ